MTSHTSPVPAISPGGSPGGPGGPGLRLITVSAAYGAGGSIVAPALAERLGLPFLQRVTTVSGPVPPGSGARPPSRERLSAAEARHTPVHRLLAAFTQAMPAGPTQSPPATYCQDHQQRRAAEADIHQLAATGGGVILGRAAAVVLGRDRGYHVRLDGPPARRAAQGAAIEDVSLEQATAHMLAADQIRTAYVRRLYRADPADPAWYHLMIDSTVIPLDTVIQIILTAAGARAA